MVCAGNTPSEEPVFGRRCYEAGNVLIELINSLVTDKARDGVVSLDEVQRILRQLGRGTVQLDRAFEAQESRCRRRLWKRSDASIRANPFKRLMVRPFETLMAGDAPVFPRVFLPNYLTVVDAAFADRISEYERQCKAVFQALMVRHGSNLGWDEFFGDGRTLRILEKALKRMGAFLETPSGQWVWLQSMSQPTVQGERPTKEQVEAVREILSATMEGLSLEIGAMGAVEPLQAGAQ